MVLDSESKRIIAQSYLLDDVVGCTPGFNFQTFAESIDRLMMGAIHFFKTMARFAIRSKRLNIVRLLIRQVMARDIEMESAAERDIECLQSFSELDNQKPTFELRHD